MANDVNVEQITNKVVNDILKQYENKYREAGKNAMKEIRTSIVKEWFGEYSFHSMVGATQYKSHVKYAKNSATIEIESYIDLDVYDDKPRAERWAKKYEVLDTPSKEYVLNLQLFEGIIGLPEGSRKFPEHNWTNPNFIQREKLWDVLINNSIWNDFENYFWKYAE